MTKVMIDPGVCGFVTQVTAEMTGKKEVKLQIRSGCESVRAITEKLGDTFPAWDLVLKHPGEGPLYDFAKENFPPHAACPVISGITKCVEVECKMALPKNATISFEDPAK